MKKRRIIALTAALCLLCTGMEMPAADFRNTELTAAAASDKLTSGSLTYTIEDGCVAISGFDGSTATLEIPAEIDGMPVVKIGATAFYGSELTSVVIPEGVTTICSGAFWHSKSLADISLPSTLTTIESYAFNDCQALETIAIPESVSYIGNAALGDTPWIAAQKEISPFVIVNGILIDAYDAVQDRLDEIQAEKDRIEEEAELAKIWKRAQIITNQVGYFPDRIKQATLLSDAADAVAFDLLDAEGNVVYSGMSTPFGYDAESGDNVHILDFTEYTAEGTYTLRAGEEAASRTFDIGIGDIYSGLTYDALNYFYQARSGIAIEEQYITSGDAAELARGAGHASDLAEIYQTWGYTASSGTQDVTGGWYDAGDHGKYVVNGGISLWMLQNQYERALTQGTADLYADSTMQIPENSNGYPDLLDEARYEMEWMLKMIVQDGDCKDMVYHKMHDIKWTALGLSPENDTQKRIIMPPSTAATLNLAACAAQSYRLWKDIDAVFAEECLAAAKNAYEAAKLHPEMYAPLTDTIDGGGCYGDDVVTDEFYWAACELYLATGDESYYTDMQASDWAFDVPEDMNGGEASGFTGSFDWGHTSSLGSMSLALYPDTISEEESKTLYENIQCTADNYLHIISEQGYGLPYKGTMEEGDTYSRYTWASNSFVVDNAIVLAYAYDATADVKYLDGAVSAMDYILGRNPLDLSYVTGYGEHSSQYPHHRWWAKQINEEFPKAPCGVLVGGPNCGLEDDVVKQTDWVAGEVPPQIVYIDDIQAYSVNECTINWNSPLAWMTSFLCEQNGGLIVGQASGGTQIPEPPTADEVPEDVHITIPDGVTGIGEQVFGKNNTKVDEVILPDSVTLISKEAFLRCSRLTSINIPQNIEQIGDKAFANTPWLTEKLAESPLLIINNILIDGTAAEGDVVIPDGVTLVLGSAFKMNTKLTSVVIPEGVTRIGAGAFNGCEALTSVSFPASLRVIEQSAFDSTGLTELTIPAGVEQIGAEAFINCKSLPEVTIRSNDVEIGREAFGCTSTFTANGQYSYIFVHQVISDFVVNCAEGSTAAAYAEETGVQTAFLSAALGDLNADGSADAGDAAQILIAAAKLGADSDPGLTDAQMTSADVNADSKVDASDAAIVLSYAAYTGSGGEDTLEDYIANN